MVPSPNSGGYAHLVHPETLNRYELVVAFQKFRIDGGIRHEEANLFRKDTPQRQLLGHLQDNNGEYDREKAAEEENNLLTSVTDSTACSNLPTWYECKCDLIWPSPYDRRLPN